MNRRRGGFTVVEALAAGLVLALSAAVAGTSVRSALRSLELGRDYQRAAELLDRTLTKIDMIGPERISLEGPTQGGFPPPNDRFRWEVRIDSRPEGYLYEVTVQIIWETSTGKRSVEAQTLLNDAPLSRSATLHWDEL